MAVVFHESVPEFVAFFEVAFAVEMVVEEQSACCFVCAVVFEDGGRGLEEDGFGLYEDDLFEWRGEDGEGAEGRSCVRSLEIERSGIEQSGDVDCCDVGREIRDEAA